MMDMIAVDDSLYGEDDEIIWNPMVREWEWQVRGKTKEDPFQDFLGYRVMLPAGSVVDIENNVEASTTEGGLVLEVMVKTPKSYNNPTPYYEALSNEYLERIRSATSMDKAKSIQQEANDVVICKTAERAVIDAEPNKNKNSMVWLVHRRHLAKECKPKLARLDIDKGKGGDSIIIHLEVAKNDVYVAKTKATLAKKMESPAKEA